MRSSNGFVELLRKLVLGMGAAASLLSCMPDSLDVGTLPRHPEELVVSTQIVPSGALLVWVTHTFGALEGGDNSDPAALVDSIAVNDALVTIDGPSGTDTLSYLGQGLYGGVRIRFRAGEEYTLHVNSQSLGMVYATTTVTAPVNFKSVQAELYDNGFGDTQGLIDYTFSDPDEENWYMVNVHEVEEADLVGNFVNPRAFTLLLTDHDFNGTVYGERFRIIARDYYPGDTVAVSLANISEAYYRFMKLRMDNRFSFVELVSEPADYPSNVVGGRGYFNLYVPDVEIFVFD